MHAATGGGIEIDRHMAVLWLEVKGKPSETLI